MSRPPTKLADIYATPKSELVEDDLSFLRGMIDKPVPKSDPIDYSFLRNERKAAREKMPCSGGSIRKRRKPTR